MSGKMTPDEWKAFREKEEASIRRLREYVEREREKLEAKRRAEASRPRGLRRLLPF
jgi:hypothetical protein